MGKQTFEFKANGSVIQDQNYGEFWRFNNVWSIAFGLQPLTTAALVDNFIARLVQEECAPYYTGSYGNGL